MKVLLLENIHPDAGSAFRSQGWDVETLSHGLEPEELERALEGISILGIRSKTRITKEALGRASQLLAIALYLLPSGSVLHDLAFPVLLVAVTLTVYSGVDYFVRMRPAPQPER